MKAVFKHIVVASLMVSGAIAQRNTGAATTQSVTLQDVKVAQDVSGLRVEIITSAPVQATGQTAGNPARILIDLSNTVTSDTNQKEVGAGGVLRIRTGQHSAVPLITRIVLDLDRDHPFTLKAAGNRTVVTVAPGLNAGIPKSGAPASPVSLGIGGVFRHRRAAPQSTLDDSLATPFPPASGEGTTAEVRRPVAKESAPVSVPQFSSAQGVQVAKSRDDSASTGVVPSDSAGGKIDEAKVSMGTTTADVTPFTTSAATSSPDVIPSDTKSMTTSSAMVITRADDPSLRTVFRVKYVATGIAYLEGGRAQGLAEGMKLEVKDSNLPARQGDSANAGDPQVIAELEVNGVAETSAVTDIHTPKRPVKAGDLAYLSSTDAETLVAQRALSSTRQYPAVISFSEGDTLEEEAREEVPRPPLPSVNRARGRVGLDYITTTSQGTSTSTSTNFGFSFRGDITRIGGSYWNLNGYYRGRFTSQNATGVQTVQDLINHTYTLSMTYDNPNSNLVAGFGRLYLPWASSLDTIDGGYFGTRLSKGATVGVFGGSTPDPTSWNFSPKREIAGSFLNFEGGGYEDWHYSSTAGMGVSMMNWAVNRPFLFLEDNVSYGRRFAVYEAAQIDSPAGNSQAAAPGFGLGRSFFTVRVQPFRRLELDLNHNYFRDVPTFDPACIGTTLCDKFLFTGFSAGGRFEVLKQVFLSTTLGRSSRSGDSKGSLNEMYGVTFNRLPVLQLRAAANFARFHSSFGSGSYESLTLSRQISENLRLELLAGQQNFSTGITAANRARFLTTTWETTLGPHYYIQGNFTVNRGQMNYQQYLFSIGYRFDNKAKGHQ